MGEFDFDLEALSAAFPKSWVPFDICCGMSKASDFARKTEHFPAEPGRLWELLASPADAPDKWVVINMMGGYVCSVCGMPVESEPCREHQPSAYARMDADTPANPRQETDR